MQVSPKSYDAPDGASSEQLFSFSLFHRKSDNVPQPGRMTWLQLCERMRTRSTRSNKDGPLISGASYKQEFTRANEAVDVVSLAILDFDQGAEIGDIETTIGTMNAHRGAACFIYTTWSHTPDTPKFRVVFPLAEPVEAADWPGVWSRLSRLTGDTADPKAKDASRMHYLPSCSKENAPFAVGFSMEGPFLDVATLPDSVDTRRLVRPSAAPSASPTGDAYAQKSLANELSRVCLATEGGRNATLNAAALNLGHFTGAGRLNRAQVEVALLNAATGVGLDDSEARKTIASGLEKGEKEPTMKGLVSPFAEIAQAAAHNAASEIDASSIPQPQLRTEKGAPEYAPRQLVELLRPGWESSALNTQGAMSQRIAENLSDSLVYVPALSWLTFDGRQWALDDRGNTATMARVLSLSKAVREEAAALYQCTATLAAIGRTGDTEAMSRAAGHHLKHSRECEQFKFAQGALSFAAGQPKMRATVEQFDVKPFVLGFQNGVWDKGVWREHLREDFLLNLCPVDFDQDADRSEWEAVLERITGGDWAFAVTLQHIAGYVLSGAPSLRTLPWLYGPPGTGKSTLADLLQTVLGEQSSQIDNKDLDGSDAKERLGAKLWNRRLAVSSEAGNKKLDAEILKTLSGSDRYQVRRLYQEQFTALPRHVLMMVANDPPKLTAYDAALKERVVALPFVHRLEDGAHLELSSSAHHHGARLEDARQDPHSALTAGFTAWAVDGLAHIFKSQTIDRAPVVLEATAKFWRDTDTLTPFWEQLHEDFLAKLRFGVTKAEVRDVYEIWCEEEGATPVHRQAWTRGCEAFGLEEFKMYIGPGKQPHSWKWNAARLKRFLDE